MYDTAGKIITLIFFVFQGYCLQYFYGSFLSRRIKSRLLNGFIITGLYLGFLTVMNRLEPGGFGDYRFTAVKMILSVCILGIIALCFYKAFCPITVFLAVTFQAIADISRYLIAIIFSGIGDGWIDLVNSGFLNGVITSEKTFEVLLNCVVVEEWLVQYAAIAFILRFLLKKIVSYYKEKDYGINGVELLFILVPSSVGLMICMLLRIIMISAEDGVPKLLYEKYPILIAVIPLILLLSLLSVLCGVKLFQDMIDRNRERSSRIILEKQIAAMREQMEETERVYSDIRRIKHDMKNTVSVIMRLSDLNSREENMELKKYLAELSGDLEKSESLFKTGNTVADTLLNIKYHEGKRYTSELQIDAKGLMFPKDLKIFSYDIGAILGNALDNAIEACVKLKSNEPGAEIFIRLYSMQKSGIFILGIENSFDGKLKLRSDEELPLTDKADKNAHGMGLFNIKSTAEKYGGTMDFQIRDRVFILSVMMKNENPKEENLL